jgi:stage V sporulation protein D (sporulation-specific penicillin-binding protein)
MGQTLGKTKLFGYIDSFGFGHKTGIDLFGEENGLIFNLKRVGPVELATTSFGQGVSVTPIQQVAAVSAAINGGKLFQPHLAKAWMNQETGEVIEQIQPKLVRQVISPETSAQVRSALESVVAKGTGANAFIDGYRVGGKTGTAQKVGPDGRYLVNNHIVSFIGFAPADDPKIVVYTAVDNPKGIQFGGVVAAPIVRNILEDSLHYLGVPPRKEQISKELKPGEQAWVEVPNLTGMKLDEIPMNFFRLKLEFSGEGNQIINQYPKPGTRVEPNTTIRVYLGSVTPPNK